jgi:hypothetical protein
MVLEEFVICVVWQTQASCISISWWCWQTVDNIIFVFNRWSWFPWLLSSKCDEHKSFMNTISVVHSDRFIGNYNNNVHTKQVWECNVSMKRWVLAAYIFGPNSLSVSFSLHILAFFGYQNLQSLFAFCTTTQSSNPVMGSAIFNKICKLGV